MTERIEAIFRAGPLSRKCRARNVSIAWESRLFDERVSRKVSRGWVRLGVSFDQRRPGPLSQSRRVIRSHTLMTLPSLLTLTSLRHKALKRPECPRQPKSRAC